MLARLNSGSRWGRAFFTGPPASSWRGPSSVQPRSELLWERAVERGPADITSASAERVRVRRPSLRENVVPCQIEPLGPRQFGRRSPAAGLDGKSQIGTPAPRVQGSVEVPFHGHAENWVSLSATPIASAADFRLVALSL